jgi:dipeptidyl aminopeptidase/acylaminoacyl peptidase
MGLRMRRVCAAVVSLLAFFAGLSFAQPVVAATDWTAADAARRAGGGGLTALSLVKLDRVSDPHVSPDGRWVVYVVRSTDYEADDGVGSLWVSDAIHQGSPRRLAVSIGVAQSPHWSSDGRAIYFLSSQSGSSQVWRTDLQGATAEQVTRLPIAVGSFRLSADTRRIVLSMNVFPDCETPQCTAERLAERAADKAEGRLYDRLYIRKVDVWTNGTRTHLFSMMLNPAGTATGTPVPLMAHFDGDAPEWGGDGDYVISLDGRVVYFAAKVAGSSEAWSRNSDIWSAPLDGSAPPVDLTRDNLGYDGKPTLSPDGRMLAYAATVDPSKLLEQTRIRIIDLRTGTTRELPTRLEVLGGPMMKWSTDGRTLLTAVDDKATTRLLGIDVHSGKSAYWSTEGTVDAFDTSPLGIVVARSSFTHPTQLYLLDGRRGDVALTNHNAAAMKAVELAAPTAFSFPGWNGEIVHGFVFVPPGARPEQRFPVAFLVHGGPEEAFSDEWSYRWNPQVFVGAGYAVVAINFHGSDGYGEPYKESVIGHQGDRPLEDLQKGWAFALSEFPFLDGARACALGPSYGGYMVYWIAGVWNQPWRCLVAHDGVFDDRMMAYTTDAVGPETGQHGGATVYEQPLAYEAFNPINEVASWSKPIMIIHGGRDFRVPVEQGIAAFTAAQRRGIASEFLYFPNEPHVVLKPHDSVEWYDSIIDWMNRWTRSQIHGN